MLSVADYLIAHTDPPLQDSLCDAADPESVSAGSKQTLLPGVNDFRTLNPDAAALWDAERNEADASSVMPNSHKKAWWRCENGHSWQQKVYAVNAGSRCPYCFGRIPVEGENDLLTSNPELSAEWDREKNGCGPEGFTAASAKKVWWKCSRGHSYEAVIFSRKDGSGCPYCTGKKVLPGFNDLLTTDPALCGEWDVEKNSLSPREVNRGSHKKIWWRCARGHSYDAEPFARVAGNGCPYCAGRRVLPGFNDLATTHPKVASQWAQDLNGGVTPQMISKGCTRKYWWRCAEGHVWQAVVFSRTRKKASECPVCAGTARRQPSVQYPSRRVAEPVYAPQRPAVN